jgi:hypothetical protein
VLTTEAVYIARPLKARVTDKEKSEKETVLIAGQFDYTELLHESKCVKEHP